ncbi:MAG: hypothetical protein KDA45_17245, partial [Planctomycetales bacterium]|nr:hypothetical protein [Planctomycetales bacterium]
MTQATLQTLRCLFSPATADRSEQQLASEFVSYHHPWVRNHLAAETLAELRRQVRGQWQALAGPVEWELWRVQELGKHLTASGPLPVQQGQLDVRAEFSEGQLLGLTLLGPSYATSTLDRFDGLQPLAESGRLFWNELLGGQIASAHARLAPAFRQQLPLQEFETLVAHSDIGQSPELSRIRWECTRLSTRLPRSEPIAFAAYYIAEFNDGSWRPLQCEFREREQQAGNFELLTFRDNVEAEFPVAGEATGEKILAAFLSGDPQQVIELTAEPERDRVQPQILQAFLNKLRKVAGSARLPERSRLMHVYAAGTRYERLSTALLLDDGQSLPFEADMQLGAIRSFYFTSPELEAFAEEVENVADLELLGNEFFRYWLTENDLPQASQRLVPALRDEQWQGRLQV